MGGILPGARISPFVAEWLPRIVAEMNGRPGPRRALDLAMGEGRHAVPLAEAGFVTFGVDLAVDRLQTARRRLLGRRTLAGAPALRHALVTAPNAAVVRHLLEELPV